MTLNIASSRKLVAALFAAVVILTLAGASVQIIKYERISFPLAGTYVELFDMDGEGNVPAWFNSGLLLLNGLLLGVIAANRRAVRAPFALRWVVLAVLFVLLSLDEEVALHERLTHRIHWSLPTDGLLKFAWVLPGMAFVLVVAAAYLRFFLRLPRRTRRLTLLSAAVYLGGALGVEMLGAYCHVRFGYRSVPYWTAVTVEEFLEMTGLVLFIHTLLDYMDRYMTAPSTQPAPSPPSHTARGK